ncbi:MAG: homocysteine S-methyltransferase family protein [Pseudomonadales bacterium]
MLVTVLDGGMGGEIKERLPGAATGLWSATALLEAPDLVVAIHREFIDAGARIITTNTYSTVPSYLGKAGLADQFEALARLAGELAQRAVRESGRAVQIAGSIPPLSESYRPDLVPSSEAADPIYAALVAALADLVDLFLCETMSSAAEARTAAAAAVKHGGGRPVYVSWTLDETPGAGLRSGERVEDAFAAVADLDLAGYLFNCTDPAAIEAALRALRPLTDKPLGGYANRLNRVPKGWTLDGTVQGGRRTDLSEDAFVASALRCVDAGATIVGGCCGIGPRYIAPLTRALAAR